MSLGLGAGVLVLEVRGVDWAVDRSGLGNGLLASLKHPNGVLTVGDVHPYCQGGFQNPAAGVTGKAIQYSKNC